MQILLTNDDGIHAPGLTVLETIARELSDDVFVVAPESDQSGVAHSLSLRKNIVHRDLKPANIMVTKAGVKLLDFGLAKMSAPKEAAAAGATETIALTKENTILGTMQYMAPEQLEGREADARADIFAFGAVLYEMLTGRKAFEGSRPRPA